MGDVLYVFSTPGLEQALSHEVQKLPCKVFAEDDGFRLEGAAGLHRQANLSLRTATRVLLRLAEFRASTFQEFQKQAQKLSFAPYFRGRGRVSLSVVVKNAPWAQARRIEEWARASWPIHTTADAPELLIRLHEHTCTVSLDTSGKPLHMRGYREEVGRAPMRETLAAGVLTLAGYDGSKPLWDVMCGSGTLLIEAALLASETAPGLLRDFAFETWPSFSKQDFEREKAEAQKRVHAPTAVLKGSDLNAGALGVTRRNARRAHVTPWLTLERLDALKLAPTQDMPPGLLVANLPYGKRVGEKSELPKLYESLGAHWKHAFSGWKFAFLAADDRAADWLGIAPTQVMPLENGGLSCQLFLGHLGA